MLELCWDHVGTFFALGRVFVALWRLLCILWALVGRLGRIFLARGRPGLDFGGFGSHPGTFLERPRLVFQGFYALAGLLFAQALDMQKPSKNLGFSYVLNTSRVLRTGQKTTKNWSGSRS